MDAFCGVGGNTIAFAKTCQRGMRSIHHGCLDGDPHFYLDVVIAIDNNPTRLALARHNAQIYGVADRIEFILADYMSFAKSCLSSHLPSSQGNDSRKIDVIFLSPPWGGPSYLSAGTASPFKGEHDEENYSDGAEIEEGKVEYSPYSLSSMKPVHGAELFHLSRKITKNVAFYLPRNTRMKEVSELLDKPSSHDGKDERAEGEGTSIVGKKKGKRKSKKEREYQGEMIEVEEEWTGSKLKALTCYFGGLASGQEDMF